MIIKECREQIEALADRLSKEVKEKEDTFEKVRNRVWGSCIIRYGKLINTISTV